MARVRSANDPDLPSRRRTPHHRVTERRSSRPSHWASRDRRRQGGDWLLPCGLDHLVGAGHPPVDLGPDVLVQDQLRDLRLAVLPTAELELRQLRQCLDNGGDRKFLLQFGDRRLWRADSDDVVRLDVGVRACALYFPGSRLLYYLMLAGLTFPIFLAIVPLFFVLRGIGLLNTLPGLILTYAAFAFPFTVFFLYAFFRSLSKSIAEAAAVDGAGEWRTFFQIMLPGQAWSGHIAILNFVGLWNQFLLPIALNTNPENYVLTQAMASFASQAGYSVDFGRSLRPWSSLSYQC